MDPVAAAILASWTLSLKAAGLATLVSALYLRGWLRLRAELPHKYTVGRLCAFAGGVVATLLAIASPVDTFSGFLLTAHMVQHMLLLMVGPPLLLLGQPVLPILRGLPRWIFKDALGPFLGCRELQSAGRAIVHPVVSWLALAFTIVVWHLPAAYELGLRSQSWHEVEHACFFLAAVLFWWPVVGVWPGHPVEPRWGMVPYLALADVVNTGLSAVLTFSDPVIYPSYRLAPRLWGISALADQATAGVIMWVPGSIAFLVPAVVLGMRLLEPGGRPAVRCAPALPRRAPRVFRPADLLRTPIFGSILRYRHFRRLAQTVMLSLALAVIADGLFGPQVAPMNLAGVLPWTYWRGLTVIALLLAGNVFCMACPFTLPRDLTRKMASPRYRWPRQLRSKWIAAALLATYLWAYEAFSLWDSPRVTAWIAVGYFLAALAVDSIFKGASFCKYVCPIGQFHFVHAMVSPFEVRVRDGAVCGQCHTHDCIRGSQQQRGCELQLFQPKKLGNFDCTFCLDCVRACPQQNVGILRVQPGLSLLEDRRGSGIGRLNRRSDVAALVLILVFGAFVNAGGMTTPVTMWMHRRHSLTALYLCALLVVPGVLATLCVWISQHWKRPAVTSKELACSFILTLVPLGFSMWLAHFVNHLLSLPGWMPPIELLFLGSGLLLTLYSTWRVACRVAADGRMALAAMCPWAALASGLYAAGVWIVFQPMQMRGMVMS